jgi:hypothetical protein
MVEVPENCTTHTCYRARCLMVERADCVMGIVDVAAAEQDG